MHSHTSKEQIMNHSDRKATIPPSLRERAGAREQRQDVTPPQTPRARKTLARRLTSSLLSLILALLPTLNYASESITYYHWDALGSPVAGTDNLGNIEWREQYRPYGERIQNQTAARNNTRWYTGHPHDDATGLTYAGARYYDPVVGRFMGVDPEMFSDRDAIRAFNRYAYGNNNPYKYIDPDGRLSIIELGVGLGVGLIAGGYIYYSASAEQRAQMDRIPARLGENLRGNLQLLGDQVRALPIFSESSESDKSPNDAKPEADREKTPTTHPQDFENVRGCKGKKCTKTGEIWEKDRLHNDHYEVYRNKRDYEKGRRDRAVWDDGRAKEKFR